MPLGLKGQGAGVVNETRDKRQSYLMETTRQELLTLDRGKESGE